MVNALFLIDLHLILAARLLYKERLTHYVSFLCSFLRIDFDITLA